MFGKYQRVLLLLLLFLLFCFVFWYKHWWLTRQNPFFSIQNCLENKTTTSLTIFISCRTTFYETLIKGKAQRLSIWEVGSWPYEWMNDRYFLDKFLYKMLPCDQKMLFSSLKTKFFSSIANKSVNTKINFFDILKTSIFTITKTLLCLQGSFISGIS